jgi:hypothetical protein
MAVAMWILGIDPGPEESAIVRYDSANNCVLVTWYGPNDKALDYLRSQDNYVVIERVSCYGNITGASTLRTAEAVGRFWQRAADMRCEVRLPSRPEICTVLCGLRNAKKAQVRARLIELHGGIENVAIGTLKSRGPLYGISKHCWDALAAAVFLNIGELQ